MSEERKKRLAKLVKLENRLKAFHESRHAGHLADANRAAAEADEVRARFDDPASLSALFPELYHRKVESSVAAQAAALEQAKAEERRIAAATVRTNRVGERYREAARVVEEQRGARERQELVDRNAGKPSDRGKPATS
jgi:hypothetical protein